MSAITEGIYLQRGNSLKLHTVWFSTGVGCSMGDTSLTKVSMETPPLHLCLQELKELLLLKSIRMQPMAPGFRYTHTHTYCQNFHVMFLYLMHLFDRVFSLCRYYWLKSLWSRCLGIYRNLALVRRQVKKNNNLYCFVQWLPCFTLYIIFLCIDKATKRVQLARKEAEDLCTSRLCVW